MKVSQFLGSEPNEELSRIAPPPTYRQISIFEHVVDCPKISKLEVIPKLIARKFRFIRA